MIRSGVLLIAIVTTLLTVFQGRAFSAQDKYTVKVPDGLAFSEFRGFEDWQMVSVSQAGDKIEVILGNPAMIEAYRAGITGEDKPFPDGAKMTKIHWIAKKNLDFPNQALVPDKLHDIDFMARDSKKFATTGNWGYAQFNYDAAADAFAPLGTGAGCGYACHTLVKAKDYVFTAYGKR